MEDYEVIWSLRAANELQAIGEYIAGDRPKAAEQVVAAILSRVGQLGGFPFSGEMFQRRREGQYREISCRKYRVYYRVDRVANRVYVAAH